MTGHPHKGDASMTKLPVPAPPSQTPVTNQAEAREVVGHISDVMDALLGVVQEETALLRAGRLRDAAELEPTKSYLAGLYANDAARLKMSASYFAQHPPSALAALKQRHQQFHSLLQTNLTVLATIHSLWEGIMRRLAEDVTRKASPQTYGASGRTPALKPQFAQPLTLSRVL